MNITKDLTVYCYSDLDKLGEMFPTVSSDHIVKCLKQANGHMNTAVEFLLMDCQSSQVMTQVVLYAYVH